MLYAGKFHILLFADLKQRRRPAEPRQWQFLVKKTSRAKQAGKLEKVENCGKFAPGQFRVHSNWPSEAFSRHKLSFLSFLPKYTRQSFESQSGARIPDFQWKYLGETSTNDKQVISRARADRSDNWKMSKFGM